MNKKLADLMGLTNGERDLIQAAIRNRTIACLEVYIGAGHSNDVENVYVPSVLFDGTDLNGSIRFVADLGLAKPHHSTAIRASAPECRVAIQEVLKKAVALYERDAGRYEAKVQSFTTPGGSHTLDPKRAELYRQAGAKVQELATKLREAPL